MFVILRFDCVRKFGRRTRYVLSEGENFEHNYACPNVTFQVSVVETVKLLIFILPKGTLVPPLKVLRLTA